VTRFLFGKFAELLVKRDISEETYEEGGLRRDA
jgi:hypothetical protein